MDNAQTTAALFAIGFPVIDCDMSMVKNMFHDIGGVPQL